MHAYVLKRSRRKTIALHIDKHGQLEVRAPHWVAKRDLDRFVVERGAWIDKHVARIRAQPQFQEQQYYLGGTVNVLGEKRILGIDALPFSISASTVTVPAAFEHAFQRWFAKSALQHFCERHHHWRDVMQPLRLPDSSINIRRMRRRWGTCRRNGVITLNTHLYKYPKECIDAVIVHELCHLVHFNHSSAFYRLMDTILPNWREADKSLIQLARQY
jgi:predicted metal-dependent hydrolase